MTRSARKHLGLTPWMFPAFFVLGLLIIPQGVRADRNDYRLGARWQVSEQDGSGVWIRRGNSNVFDGQWSLPGQPDIQGVLEMNIDDRNVRIRRTDNFTNLRCEYRGQISRDGRSAQGWVSCNNGPRMNWNATIFQAGEYQGSGGFGPPPSRNYERREGPIVPKYNGGFQRWRFDMTGVWSCNDGGTYYIRQLGNNLWWYGESSNGQWSNIFHGALDGDWLEGLWLDVPKGRDRDNGAMRLHIDSINEFHRESKSGDDFGGSQWRRIR